MKGRTSNFETSRPSFGVIPKWLESIVGNIPRGRALGVCFVSLTRGFVGVSCSCGNASNEVDDESNFCGEVFAGEFEMSTSIKASPIASKNEAVDS